MINIMAIMSLLVIVSHIIQSLQGVFLILGSKSRTLWNILFFKNHIWWHDKVIVVLDVTFQGSNIKFFRLQEHQDAMYNGHVGVAKTWKRM